MPPTTSPREMRKMESRTSTQKMTASQYLKQQFGQDTQLLEMNEFCTVPHHMTAMSA